MEMSDSAETNCLFVGDLSIFTSEEMLSKVFAAYGVIDHVKVIRCEATHKNLSYGFVRFEDVASAAKAKQEQDGQILCGRPMRYGFQTPIHYVRHLSSFDYTQNSLGFQQATLWRRKSHGERVREASRQQRQTRDRLCARLLHQRMRKYA
ncbi:RNA-binding protein [archaeon]|nr:MAG: RNA-binding protein [archaeon]